MRMPHYHFTIHALCFLSCPWIAAQAAALKTSPCTYELGAWLYDTKEWLPPGYHALCIDRGSDSADLRIELWVGGHAAASPVKWSFNASGSLEEFRKMVQKKSKMKKQKRWKVLPWALFDTTGHHVTQVSQLHGILLAFEGGQWVWPGIREGFERVVPLDLPRGAARNVTLKTLTLDPLAFTIEDFLSAKVAKHVITVAAPQMKPAGMVLPDGDQSSYDEARTCSETWVDPKRDKKLEAIAQMTASFAHVSRELQESFRVLQYKKGQHFWAHTDYYETEHFQDNPEIREALSDGRNWLLTFFLYLQPPKSGGQTYFPSTYGKPLPEEGGKCDGPAVTPRTGGALLFYSLHPDSTPNLSSIHGSCKVISGVKYTVNIWMWNQPSREQLAKRRKSSTRSEL